jgi:hypothetical protein
MELVVMQLRSEAEEFYLSKECKEPVIQLAVKDALKRSLEENKISSTDYQEALDILKRYELRQT